MKFTPAMLTVAAAALVPLAACSQPADTPETSATTEAVLTLADARLVLPAVGGNPAALYFDVSNPGTSEQAITSVAVEGAGRAELHSAMDMGGKMTMESVERIAVPAGGGTSLQPGGLHVMAFDLDPALQADGSTEITLTLENGETFTAPVTILGAGDDR